MKKSSSSIGTWLYVTLVLVTFMIGLFFLVHQFTLREQSEIMIEQAALGYLVASGINSLSTVEDGQITKELKGKHTIEFFHQGKKTFVKLTTFFDDREQPALTQFFSGDQRTVEADPVPIFGEIEKSVVLQNPTSICLTKKAGSKVVVSDIC